MEDGNFDYEDSVMLPLIYPNKFDDKEDDHLPRQTQAPHEVLSSLPYAEPTAEPRPQQKKPTKEWTSETKSYAPSEPYAPRGSIT